MHSKLLFLALAASLLLGVLSLSALPAPQAAGDKKPNGPLLPRDEQMTFRVPKGFRVELVASEPDVIDPVAMAFDEDGRIFVAEMPGYPNKGVGTGAITSGRVRMLVDRDGDGFYETSTIFADKLRFPTAVMPWQGGLLVGNAPDLIYLKDTKGTGKADRQEVLYTGFDLANIQQLLSGFQWSLDNWVYACAGGKGGSIESGQKKGPPVVLRGRGFRFHPEVPGSLEPMSGGGQYGLAADDWGQWFTATNSQHLRHIVLPDHYLRRNPFLPVSAVTLDIPDHSPACKVHRISPFEAWRVERTKRRKDSPDSKRFPTTELVPGGYITSACSPVVYTADVFPQEYRGNTFVCDPANNLVHRDVLVPNGATFIAQRGDADHEFLASTDNWFRPVWLTVGPDGALYVLDFYREVIETPLSLPPDILAKLNVESRGRGRIWKVYPEGKRQVVRPRLSKAPSAQLVEYLDSPNSWWRLTAQRLLVERQDKSVAAALKKLARGAKTPQGRAHALWTLHGLGALADGDVALALVDPTAEVVEQALRLAEERLGNPNILKLATALTEVKAARVRFQLAFTLGGSDAPEAVAALARIARQDVGDPRWMQTAILSSSAKTAPALLKSLAADPEFHKAGAPAQQFLGRLALLVASQPGDEKLAEVLALLAPRPDAPPAAWQIAVLDGLGQGLQNGARPLPTLWEKPPPALAKAIDTARPLFAHAAAVARDEKRTADERTTAVRLLGYGPFATVKPALQELLAPQQPGELQLAAVRALSAHDQPQVADVLLKSWGSYSPTLRREVLEALFARPQRLDRLLTAIEAKQVLAGQLEPARLAQLRKHPNAKLRQRAEKLLAGLATPARAKVVADYQAALDLKADVGRGRMLFRKTCATCHRLEEHGVEVGPDLLSALRNKTPEALLVDILDPSREVDPRYIDYVVTLTNGKQLSGMIAAETAASVTLRRAEKAEDTLLRSQIDTIQATAKSVMPEGLEMQLSRQDVADVIAYLQAVAAK
jgi:putative membrane-bound dehydrogenase-like protein